MSYQLHVKYGVPQGSVLGPLCFPPLITIYYANDTQIYISSRQGNLQMFSEQIALTIS